MYNIISDLCRYPFQLCRFFLLNPSFCYKVLYKAGFILLYFFFKDQECSLENWVFAHVSCSEEMLQNFLKITLDNFKAMEMNQTFESALLFWKKLGRWVLHILCKRLSKNQNVIFCWNIWITCVGKAGRESPISRVALSWMLWIVFILIQFLQRLVAPWDVAFQSTN